MRFLPLAATVLSLAARPASADDLAAAHTVTRAEIIAEGDRMADAQLQALAGKKTPVDWIGAVMWTGLAEYAAVSPQKDKLQQAVRTACESIHWTPVLNPKDPHNADDQCIGQAILDVYTLWPDRATLAPLIERADRSADKFLLTAFDNKLLSWFWCDTLFMAPAVYTRLSAITGDRRYIEAGDKEWAKTAALLYDKDDHLFYRDAHFFPDKRKSKNGKKIFWARGNGWVVSGLTRVIDNEPKDWPLRNTYIKQFKEMAEKLATLQQPDGTWAASLLDPEEFPDSEFSGTAFFCQGMAWGINAGLLEKERYLPVITKAWAALLAGRRPDGLPGYVQPPNDQPAHVPAGSTQLYATGAFLMAARQLTLLAPFDIPAAPKLTETTPSTPTPAPVATPSPTATPAPNP